MVIPGLSKSLSNIVSKISRLVFIDKRAIREIIRDIQRALLQADVSVDLVLKISQQVEKRSFEEKVPPGFTRRDVVLKVLYEELLNLLGGSHKPKISITKKPYIILLLGIQGSGKTTSAAKLAYFFKNKGYKVALICADNFRPGALAQLQQLAKQIEVPVYGDPSKDALSIIREGLKYYSSQRYEVIIIDTAGRHKDEKRLMEEMKEIFEKASPDEVILVLDSTIGKQARVQAEYFNKIAPLGSIFLTKLDGSAKGGGALAAVVATGARIKFIGVGEKIEDIELFDPPSFVNRLLGMGDLQALVEKMKSVEAFDKERIERFLRGKITLLDFKQQLEAMKKMGPLSKILEMLPGELSTKLSPDSIKLSEDKMKKWIVALNSMTKEELLNPSILNGSRIRRIAKGAGVTTRDVRELLKAYDMMKKYAKTISRGRKRLKYKFK